MSFIVEGFQFCTLTRSVSKTENRQHSQFATYRMFMGDYVCVLFIVQNGLINIIIIPGRYLGLNTNKIATRYVLNRGNIISIH